MDIMQLYTDIMLAESEMDVVRLNIEIQAHITAARISDDMEIMLLNMALQVKSNYFLMREMALNSTMTVIMGDVSEFDPEEMQLEEFRDDEFEDFKDGNVVLLADFKKK